MLLSQTPAIQNHVIAVDSDLDTCLLQGGIYNFMHYQKLSRAINFIPSRFLKTTSNLLVSEMKSKKNDRQFNPFNHGRSFSRLFTKQSIKSFDIFVIFCDF